MTLPAIPDPTELAGLTDPEDRVLALVEPASRWLETATAEQASDTVAKAAGIETYLRQIKATEAAVGAAQIIALRARMRRAEVLIRPRGGDRRSTSPRGDVDPVPKPQRDDEYRDRTLARNRETVERIADDLRRKGEASRAQVLRYLRREQRRNVDADARSIIPSAGVDSVTGDGWTVLGGSFVDTLAGWPTESVDMILTDPPYPADALPLWGELADLAARVLVPNGVLVALTGQILLPDVLDQVRRSGLRFGWVYCQLLPGQHSRILGRNLAQSWKPWLVLTNGGWPVGINERHEDVLPTSPAEKAGYAWRQTVGPARYLVEHLSPNGGVVLDPFTGTGTYGVAALEAGRRFVGVEADAGRLDLAARRLGEAAA